MMNIFGISLILLCLGCNAKESDQLSLQQKEQIKNQVKAVADSIWTKWEEMNPEGALQYYSDSPDWVCINSEGSQYDFQAYKKLANQFKNAATAYKWTTIQQDFPFITKEIGRGKGKTKRPVIPRASHR